MIRCLPLRIAAAALTPLLVLQPKPAACAPTASPEMRMDHISIVKIGRGSPIVLIPGLGSPRATWDGVAPALAQHHTVYLVQINGFAGDAPGANLQPGILDGVVADLRTYLMREKTRAVPVVGHSLGGLVALMLAKAAPVHVSRLMIVDSLPYIGLLFSPDATVPMVEPQAKKMRDQMMANYGKPAYAAYAEAAAARLALKPESRAAVKTWTLASDPRVSGEALYEDMTTDVRPDLPKITVPITLIYPASADGHEKPKSETMYKSAYASAPHVTLVAVSDSAHFVMLDQPERFAALLGAFADGK